MSSHVKGVQPLNGEGNAGSAGKVVLASNQIRGERSSENCSKTQWAGSTAATCRAS